MIKSETGLSEKHKTEADIKHQMELSAINAENNYNKAIANMTEMDEAIQDFFTIYPSESINFFSKDTHFPVDCLTNVEAVARLNNFILFSINSVTIPKEKQYSENNQSIEKLMKSCIEVLGGGLTSSNNSSDIPMLCYGICCKNKKINLFIGIQRSLQTDREIRIEENKYRKEILEKSLKQNKIGWNEIKENLFSYDANKEYYSGLNCCIPKKDVNNSNFYNKVIRDPEDDYTILILSKPVSVKQKKEYRELIGKSKDVFYKIRKQEVTIGVSIKDTISYTENHGESLQKSKNSSRNKVIEAGSGLLNAGLGAAAGISLGGFAVAIPFIGTLATPAIPVLAVGGAILGSHYLKDITGSFTSGIKSSKTTTSTTSYSRAWTCQKSISNSKKIKQTIQNQKAEDLYNLADEAYKRLDNKNVVFQTMITYSSSKKSQRDTIRANIIGVTGDICIANDFLKDRNLQFIIPENFFRTGGFIHLNEITNLVSNEDLGNLIKLPTEDFPDKGFTILTD